MRPKDPSPGSEVKVSADEWSRTFVSHPLCDRIELVERAVWRIARPRTGRRRRLRIEIAFATALAIAGTAVWANGWSALWYVLVFMGGLVVLQFLLIDALSISNEPRLLVDCLGFRVRYEERVFGLVLRRWEVERTDIRDVIVSAETKRETRGFVDRRIRLALLLAELALGPIGLAFDPLLAAKKKMIAVRYHGLVIRTATDGDRAALATSNHDDAQDVAARLRPILGSGGVRK